MVGCVRSPGRISSVSFILLLEAALRKLKDGYFRGFGRDDAWLRLLPPSGVACCDIFVRHAFLVPNLKEAARAQ